MSGKVEGTPRMPRPKTHVTVLLYKLRQWRDARRRKGVKVSDLEDAILYLTEYRDDALPVLHGLWRAGIETKRT